MKTTTLLAILAAAMISTTEAVKVKSDESESTGLAGAVQGISSAFGGIKDKIETA